jgi:hypothetical protein
VRAQRVTVALRATSIPEERLLLTRTAPLEAKTFEEGLRWFRIAWPLPKEERAKSAFLRWVAAA